MINRFLTLFWLGFAANAFAAEEKVKVEEKSNPSEWPHSRANVSMGGVSESKLSIPLQLVWQVPLTEKIKRGEMMVASAVIRAGKVYVGCKEGTFHCLELETGKEVWKATTFGAIDGAAAFSGELVIAGSQDGMVYAWNVETGKEAWKFESEAEIHAAANVWVPPGQSAARVYIGSHDYSVYCLDAATGAKLWAAETGYYINGGSAIGDGKVVFGGCDSVLHVHDAVTGEEARQIEVGAYIGNNVAIADGIIYLSHYGSKVEAYAMQDGMKVWEYGEREFEFYSAPAILGNWVVVGGRDKRMHGIDRTTGKGKWEFRARDRIDSSPVICGGDKVVFGCDDGYVYVLGLEDGKELWNYEIGAPVKTSPAVTDKWVVLGADDGMLYGFKQGDAAK